MNVTFIFNFDFNLIGHSMMERLGRFGQCINHPVVQLSSLQQLIQIGAALNRLCAAALQILIDAIIGFDNDLFDPLDLLFNLGFAVLNFFEGVGTD